MSSFRTEFRLPPAGFEILHQHGIVALGSCFTEHIGARLTALKFNVNLNPFGILYHPLAIAGALNRLYNPQPYTEEDLELYNGFWHSFDHHGRFNHPNPSETLRMINTALAYGAAAMKDVDHLLLTFGTATIYTFKQTGKIVANCHKFPGSSFDRRRLSVPEIVDAYLPLFEQFHQNRPNGQIILTVSPVRHLREGFVENQRSKAVLVLAAEALCKQFSFVSYFPAYELVLDDLRDYRFYAADMVHPSPLAIDYIWAQWMAVYFGIHTRQLVHEIEKIQRGLAHRPFHPGSSGHLGFVQKLNQEMDTLEARWPSVNFSEERAALQTAQSSAG